MRMDHHISSAEEQMGVNLTLQPVLLGSGWILIWEGVCHPLITNYSEPSTCLVSMACSINTVFVE